MARTRKLTPELTKRIADFVRGGNRVEVATAAAGVAESTFYGWMERGRKERERTGNTGRPRKTEAIFVEFLEEIERARAEAEIRSVLIIQKAAQDPKYWQAAAWMLTHGHAKEHWKEARNDDGDTGRVAGAIVDAVNRIASTEPLPGE